MSCPTIKKQRVKRRKISGHDKSTAGLNRFVSKRYPLSEHLELTFDALMSTLVSHYT